MHFYYMSDDKYRNFQRAYLLTWFHKNFFTIPDLDKHDQLDPRSRNPQSFANTISLNDSDAVTAHVKMTDMHVWH